MATDVEPIVTREPVAHTTQYEDKVWTYDEIFEIWEHATDELVPQLARRCIAYEQRLAAAEAERDECRLLLREACAKYVRGLSWYDNIGCDASEVKRTVELTPAWYEAAQRAAGGERWE